jgi:type I restriction enzyme, S subunit
MEVAQGWLRTPLGEAVTFQRGFDLPQRLRAFGTVPLVSSAGVTDFHASAMVRGPGVVTGRYGTIGGVFLIEEPFWPLNTTLFVRDFHGNEPRFVFYMLQRFDFKTFSGKSGVPGVNRNELHRETVSLPSSTGEQRAIAEVLSDVDALLGGLDRLITKKHDLKQAAMQQLLTGKTRLPGFHGEWEDAQVQDVIAGFFCGPSPTCEERNIQDESEWGVLKTTAATRENGWDWTKHKALPRVYWNKPHIELKKGDVIVTKAGPRHRVGVTAWVNYVPPRIIPSGKMIALRPRPDKVTPLMLAAAISARGAQTYLAQRTTGMAESQVNFENIALREAPITIPSIEEQAIIAAVLSDVDAELAALEARRDKTRDLKQAMMRELLTGKTRLVPAGVAHA